MPRGCKGKKALSLQEQKELADINEQATRQEAEEFKTWMNMVETMDGKELKEYTEQNKEAFKSDRRTAAKKVQRNRKTKTSSYNSAIMAAVWKFHKDDDEDPAGIISQREEMGTRNYS